MPGSGSNFHKGGILMNKRSVYLATPALVIEYIGNVEFPASREKLLEAARNHIAPEEVIYTLEHLPDREYKSPVDLSNSVAKLE
jgi:hypothetical protein